ncbi:MAG: DNA ligase [Gammaproteobacteria bacterium]|nr:DNA ligase [Gammaproteobacteria bacterium]
MNEIIWKSFEWLDVRLKEIKPAKSKTALQQVLLLIVFFIGSMLLPVAQADNKPDLMLAKTYRQGIDISQYWVSEKLDGVRARWDGAKLISRGGKVFAAPAWFIEGFPPVLLDGELWMGRGRYEETVSVVRRKHAHDGWKQVRLMLFDLPAHGGMFSRRLTALQQLAAQTDSPYLAVIKQFRAADEAELMHHLQSVIDNGGEGLMLHHQTARYASGRSSDLLKLKLFTDAEAVVIGYRPGKGKFAGLVGSLKVRTEEGAEFYVGSGLSREQRQNPPPVSSRITFRYQGLTKNGIPRFPVFLRVRNEQPE